MGVAGGAARAVPALGGGCDPGSAEGTPLLVQTRKVGDVSGSKAGMPSLGCKVSRAGQQPGALQVQVRLRLCNFIACWFCFLMFLMLLWFA